MAATELRLGLMVAHPSLPVKNVRQLIALAKAHPGELTFSSSGAGGAPHLGGELFNRLADVVADEPEQFGKFWRAESEKWARVIKDAHIKAN